MDAEETEKPEPVCQDRIPVDVATLPPWRVPKSAPMVLLPGSSVDTMNHAMNDINRPAQADIADVKVNSNNIKSKLAHATPATYPDTPPGKWQKCSEPPKCDPYYKTHTALTEPVIQIITCMVWLLPCLKTWFQTCH